MILLFSILVTGCILVMGLAFIAASALGESVSKLEDRARLRAEADIQKGEPK